MKMTKRYALHGSQSQVTRIAQVARRKSKAIDLLGLAAGTRDLREMIFFLQECWYCNSAVGLVLNQWTIAQGQSGVFPPVGSSAA